MATLSIVFVESAYSAAGITDQASHISHKLLSILVLVSISVANSISTKASTRLNSFFVVVKFMGVFAVVIAGLAVVGMHIAQPEKVVGGGDWAEKSWFEYRNSLNPDGTETDWSMIGQWQMFGHLAAALYAALWAYSGWDKVSQYVELNERSSRMLCWMCAREINVLTWAIIRQYMCRQSFQNQHASYRSPSIARCPSLLFAFFSLALLIISCCHGKWFQQPTVLQW